MWSFNNNKVIYSQKRVLSSFQAGGPWTKNKKDLRADCSGDSRRRDVRGLHDGP